MGPAMLISVIIPHLNQEAYLKLGLEALHAQRAISGKIEIIVVDNGSARLPSAVCSAWADVRLVSESIPGPGPARNRGILEARGDILAFIDADCRADAGWLAAIEVLGSSVGTFRSAMKIPRGLRFSNHMKASIPTAIAST